MIEDFHYRASLTTTMDKVWLFILGIAVLLAWAAWSLSGCASGGYYYPSHDTLPHGCTVSDGYCYRHVILDNQEWAQTYMFSPKYGWTLQHQDTVP